MGFGAKAVDGGKSEDVASVWHEAPGFEEVREVFIRVGSLKAAIELLELEISEIERGVKRGSRKADDTDAAKEASKDKRRELAQKKAALYEAQAYQDWLNFRREIFKSVVFQTR